MDDLPFQGIEPIWKVLRGQGHLWHITSLQSLGSILKCDAIVPNRGQFPDTCCQSPASFARHLGGVSIFDFDTECPKNVLEHICDFPLLGVLIRLSRHDLDQSKLILPTQVSNREPPISELRPEIRQSGYFVPYAEAIYLGSIPTSAFTGYLLTDEAGRHHEVEANDDAFRTLSEIDGEWTLDRKRRIAERVAKGEFVLEAAVKASFGEMDETSSDGS